MCDSNQGLKSLNSKGKIHASGEPVKSSPQLYLLDGSSYIYRAYYGIRDLATTGGMPTNAVFGFTRMLLGLLQETPPRLSGRRLRPAAGRDLPPGNLSGIQGESGRHARGSGRRSFRTSSRSCRPSISRPSKLPALRPTMSLPPWPAGMPLKGSRSRSSPATRI